MLIIKSQLNNDVNCNGNFQKKRIPLFMFNSKCPCGYHTNPKLAILQDFAEECILEIRKESTQSRKSWNSFNVTPCEIKKGTSVGVHLLCLIFFDIN